MRRIETAYEVRGMVSRVSSFDSATVGSGALVNEVVLTYNSFGQLTNDQQSHAGAVSGSTAQVQYAYANGSANTIRPNTLTYPNGRVLNMNYGTASSMSDALSRVAALVDSNGTTQLSTYSYLGMAAPVEVPYPVPNLRYTLIGTAGGNDPDTGDIYYGLDRFGRIKDLLWRNFTTATNVVRLQHGYDRAGNRLFRKDLAANAAGQRFDELYTYDGSDRLAFMRRGTLNATNTAIAGGTLRAQQCFTLDSTGNWLGFRDDTNGDGTWDLVQSRTANTVNEITDITNTTGAAWIDPVYNTVGNMTTLPQPAAPTTSYTATYDAWNRLVRLADGANTVADYAYDGRKFRIVSRSYTAGVLSETRHHYYTAGWQCVEERLGTSPDSASADLQYVWGPRYVDDLVLRDKSSERLFAMQDANWNVVAIADASAVVQERYAYSPYGVPVFLTPTFTARASSSFTWQRLFTGQTFDTQTGLHYFRNRMLHSQVGTFITRDPIGYADGLHLYRAWFVPMKTDPTGQTVYKVTCYRTSELTWVREPHDGFAPGGHYEQHFEYRTVQYVSGLGTSPCPDGWSVWSSEQPRDLDDIIDNLSNCMEPYARCDNCTTEMLSTIRDRIKQAVKNMPVITGRKENCERWAQAFQLEIEKLGGLDKRCVSESGLHLAARVGWGPGKHAVFKIVLCDGSVIYADNGFVGGGDNVGIPSDVPGWAPFPLNPVTRIDDGDCENLLANMKPGVST